MSDYCTLRAYNARSIRSAIFISSTHQIKMASRILPRYAALYRNVINRQHCLILSSPLYKTLKVSRLWQVLSRHTARLRVGTFLTTSLAASRGFSLWGSKPKAEADTAPELVQAQPEAAPEPVQASPEAQACEEADRLYDANKSTELYEHLIRFKDTDNDDLLWRLARACRCVGQLSSSSKEDKKRLTFESLDFAERALKANGKNFASHKWYAICLSEVGDYKGIKEKIANAFIIKEHFEQAILLNPQDATSVHLLGLWCYWFADMAWYERKAVALVFATPPESTYAEALEKFLAAEKLSPNFYSKNLYMLGQTYQKMGNKKMALLYFSKAKDYDAKTEEDRQVIHDAKAQLKSM